MLSVSNLSKTYGANVAFHPVTRDFAEGRTTVLIGPSGCGKSTLLRLLVGLIDPTTGSITVNGQLLTPANVERVRHSVGYVLQDGGLFPHLTAEGNVTLLARVLHRPPTEIAKRVAELAELVQLPREMLSRFPSDLSGGQRQRVGLMRALFLDPPILLLDEPLGALDPITRRELQEQLKDIFAHLHKTVVLVTHDMGEATFFGDEIVLMRGGHIVQSGSKDDLLNHPAAPYVTEFIRAQRPLVPEAMS